MNLRHCLDLLRCSARYWSKDNVSTTGAALAYYCAFSIAPLIVILLSIAGIFLGEESAYTQLGGELTALFGPSTAITLLSAAKASEQMHGLVSTIVSIVSLLFGATTVLSALQTALDLIWRSGSLVPSGVWGWLRARFLSLGFILALGFLLLVSLTLSTALSQIQHHVDASKGVWVSLITVLDFFVSLTLVGSLFALIFRYMPARHTPWRWSLLGGLLTAALFEFGRWAIGLYLAHSTQPNAFGAAASFAALLLWLYYTAQIFLFGAEFTACAAGLHHEEEEKSAASARTNNKKVPAIS